MQTYASDLTTAQSKIAALESKLETLTKEVASLRVMVLSSNNSKHRVLIGEAAFTLDQVASGYVMGPEPTTYTIGELNMMAKDNELEPEQMKKWEQFCKFLRGQGWVFGKLCAQSRLLKELRRPDAHSTPEEKAVVSKADLVKWVEEEPSVTAPAESKKFLDLVSMFGKGGAPLLPMADVSAVVNAP